jgi:uncharacterized protein YdeI (YjbR/CyaY-like superfamily)
MKKNMETFYITNRKDWRVWLRKNHKKKNEVWLVYYKKHTGKPRIPYNDAVEEALCYGWIDSIIKRVDDEKYVRKFTPRRPGSRWSKLNIERAKKMIDQKKMTKPGLVLFKKRLARYIPGKPALPAKINIPADLWCALAKNKIAMENFKRFAHGYKRTYLMYINAAKKKETRARRIKKVVELAGKNIKAAML